MSKDQRRSPTRSLARRLRKLRPQLSKGKNYGISIASCSQTVSSIDLSFRDNVGTVREHQHTKRQPPVRPQSPRRRPLPVSKENDVDAKRRRTARSFSVYSIVQPFSTSCQKLISIGAPILSLEPFEKFVDAFCFGKRRRSKPSSSSDPKIRFDIQHNCLQSTK